MIVDGQISCICLHANEGRKCKTKGSVYNAHFFPAEKALKIEIHIVHRILCVRLESLISM